MKPTLLVLAAGMGSRYGGLKQMDGLGPNGETIIDFMDISLSKLQELVMDREAYVLQSMGLQTVGHD